MSTPKLNPVGYQESGVVQMDGFKHADFALAHGSGDDNGESSLPSASSR
jgi:dipeptidyl aminopeptidase